MCIGVCSYSFAIGSLSSVLSTLDTKKAKLKSKLNILEELKNEFKLDFDMYNRLKRALKYDNTRDESEKLAFIEGLPSTLKNDMAVIMHQKIIANIPFFQNRPPHFIAFAAPLLKPLIIPKDEYIFSDNEPINESEKINI